MMCLDSIKNKNLQEKFAGHDVEVYDMGDALYIEDHTGHCSYTYLLGSKKLIKHTA